MNAALYSFLGVIAVSLVSLLGLASLGLGEERVRKFAAFAISFAVGALLGDAFIHLVPEIFERAGSTPLTPSLLILGGMLLFFVVEKLLRHQHLLHHPHDVHHVQRPELAAINLFGDAIHNFIDGLLIGASYLVSPTLGATTTLAVLLHEIPQELADFGVLVHSGLTPRRAVLLNLASAAVAIAGTAAALLWGATAHERATTILLPMTAGGFVYIAAADLIPELQHDRSVRALVVQTSLIAAGIGIMALLTLVG